MLELIKPVKLKKVNKLLIVENETLIKPIEK